MGVHTLYNRRNHRGGDGACLDMDQQRLDVEERIRQILISRLDIEPSIVAASNLDTPLLGRGIGLDSVEAMALAVGIEEEFDIEIPDEDLTAGLFQSIAALADYVQKRRPLQTQE